MTGNELEVRTEGDVVVFEPQGHIDGEAVRHLVELAGLAAAAARSVHVDLDAVSLVSDEGAEVLLFGGRPSHRLPDGAVLRASGRSARQAVLRAYAGRRAGNGAE